MDYENERRPRGLYRSRDGMIFGVCRGIGEYFDLDVFWLRVAAIVGFIVTGFFPLGVIYIVAALIMRKEPLGYY